MRTEPLMRDCLVAALAAGGQPVDGHDAAALAKRFVEVATKGAPARLKLAAALKLRSEELDLLRAELQRWLAERAAAAAGTSSRNLRLSELRCLMWFETAQALGAPASLPRPQTATDDHLAVFKLLRALELMMRALLEEVHPDMTPLAARLRELFPADYREALRRGQGDPLSGLFLKDLIRFFVDPAEWSSIGRLFVRTGFLSLLRDKRDTAASFLEDVRRIRNTVAHLKAMSAVQVELLGLYYEELVEPVRDAFRFGGTNVDPGRFESASPAVLRAYMDEVRAEVGRESRRTRRIAWAGLGVSLLLAAVSVPLLFPALRLRLNPDLEYLDAYRHNPADQGALALQACERGLLPALARLAEQPGAATAVAGLDSDALHARVVELAAHDPVRLTPCVATLHAMGWDADRIGGNTVGSYFGNASQAAPAAYRSYLAAHPHGLLGEAALSPADLRAPALMLAVWHGDASLARALVKAGAKPTTPAVVDGLAAGRRGDLPVTDSQAEARRIGDAELLVSLQG